jgi:hypothetical protein
MQPRENIVGLLLRKLPMSLASGKIKTKCTPTLSKRAPVNPLRRSVE